MKRRSLLAAAGSAAAIPSWSFAQSTLRRVAVLVSAAESDPEGQARILGLRQGLKELGWVEGQNMQMDVRFAAGNPQRIQESIAALVATKPDVIAVNSPPALDAAHKATKSIPIVIMLAVDPVRLGYVDSLAHPGGNITGFSFYDADLIGKWVQLLKEASPSLSHATIVHNPANTPFYPKLVSAAETLSGMPNVALRIAAFDNVTNIDRTISEAARQAGGSVIVPSDPFNLNHRAEIATAAIRHHLPLISIFPSFARSGALLTYGPDTTDIYRKSASYVDRILRGARPAELPVQAPTRYELMINLKTAAALGLTLPPSILARADEVIE